MTDKSTILRTFNKHFFDFLDDIKSILPENKEISYAITSFDTIKRANPTIIIKAWYSNVFLPYKDVIDNGDLSFFIEKDYGSDLAHLNKSEEILKMINNIRRPIKDMDETNKNHSLKYIQNLNKLSEIYSN
uniref:Uncharacterized protein n=1 Tax=viral metagenome TaxID=1070528 RepID=A0A6C0JGG0_9ZZZZ